MRRRQLKDPRRRALLAAPLLLLPATTMPAAAAGNAFALFDALLANPAATLTFRQRSYDGSGAEIDSAGGTLSYQRPNKFRLQYDTPDNPLIVSDGDTVWLYEAELAQVIKQPFAAAQKNGLLEVLASGDLAALQRDYILTAGSDAALHWLNAEAVDTGASIKKITLGFTDSGALQQVIMIDQFDSSVQMHIDKIAHDIADPASTFSFTPPPGSEIIDAP